MQLLKDSLVQVLTLVILVLRFCHMAKDIQVPVTKNLHGSQGNDLSELDQSKNCANFSVGNLEKKEFYSPGYPNNYPNNTECILTLTAPPNYVIRLDFLDKFHLEDSPTCEYDRLEVRNGLHGYSELISKFCGDNFPDVVTSTDRYLWLKFTSDDSIESSGFRGVYQYYPLKNSERPPPEECKFHRGGSAGIISNTDIDMKFNNYSTKWKTPIDCTWVVEVEEGYKIYLHFPDYKLGVPNNCEVNYVDIYEDKLTLDKQLVQFCGTSTEPQKSKGNILHIHFFVKAEEDAMTSRFELVYTALRESTECNSAEFNCEDGTCIEKSLKCNEQFNCKYRYDEDAAICFTGSKAGVVLTSEHMIIILIVFFALVFGMCASIAISCYSKIKERRDRERELKNRRSKEASVEIGLDRSVTSLDRGLEAALAAQAAEICARRKTAPGSAGSTRAASRQRGGFVSDEDDEDGGCYVPDMDMAVYRKHPNGGPASVLANRPMVNTISDPKSSTTPSYHYYYDRRDSQDSGSQSPPLPPPPPPPPPPQHLRNRARAEEEGVTLCPHGNPLVPRPDSLEEEDEDIVPSLPQRFRAEAVIEMNPSAAGGQQGAGGPQQGGGGPCSRARSFESTRSAPDVIVHR